MSAPLYNMEILRLASSVADRARLKSPDASVERRSPTCGSRVIVDVTIDAEGRVAAYGQEVRACALGQASAVLMGQHVIGRTAEEIATAAAALRSFLSGERDDPGVWPGLEVFAPARPHSARHPSILLAFDAAAQAAHNAGL
jgi:NifU-like protein involved in Fe-S cluster formation